jgi:glutamine amidotransferase
MIGLVDYGVGNTGSLGNALHHLGLRFLLSADSEALDNCERLILPGVGAFGPAMERLHDLQLDRYLREWAASGRPLLGICLGMQLLLSKSYEHGHHPGLNLIPGEVKKIQDAPREVHTGWNEVVPCLEDQLLPDPGYGYFVHSYYCAPDDPNVIIACTDYGGSLAAVIRSDNLVGIQFHPEKSQAFGLDILRRYGNGSF